MNFVNKLFAATVGGILMCSAAAVPRGHGGPLDKDDVTSVLGVNIHDLSPSSSNLDLIQEAGIRWIRMDIGWDQVETTTKGQYNYSAVRPLFDELAERNIGWIAILGDNNKLYNNINDKPHLLRQGVQEAWANFAGAIAKEFSQTNTVLFEMTNEPNGMGGYQNFPEIYSNAVALASNAIHRAKGVVAGPAVANLDYSWLTKIFENGVLTHIDYLTLHPYRSTTPESVAKDYDKVKELVSVYNHPDHALQITQGECGYGVNSSADPGIDLAIQAKFAVRMYLTAISKQIFPAIWYDWRSSPVKDLKAEHMGLVDSNLKPLPGWHAVKAMNDLLLGFSFVSNQEVMISVPSLPDLQDGAISLRNSTHVMVVVWGEIPYKHNVQLKFAVGCWKAYDWMGVEYSEEICATGGKNHLNVIVKDAPVYLVQGKSAEAA